MSKSVLYGHLDSINVKVGQILRDGDTIGVMGNTGYSFGAHLHIAVVPNTVKSPWYSANAVGLGGTKEMLQQFVDAGRLFANNLGRRPYVVTTVWNGYANHFALDLIAGGGGSWPSIVWNQPLAGKVITVTDFGSARTGKTVVVEFGDVAVGGSTTGGSTEASIPITITNTNTDVNGAVRQYEISSVNSGLTAGLELLVQDSKNIYQPPLIGNLTLERERQLNPSKLKFETTTELNVPNGSALTLKKDGQKVFMGFIFSQKTDGEKLEITAYDQIRYLKNKDSYVFKGMRADQILAMIAKDFKLQTGALENTGHVIPSRIEDSTTLNDMISNAMAETLTNTKKLYVIYDDFGKLTLKNIADMKLYILIDDETAQDYEKTVSIDGKTYNKIKLYRDNKEKGVREIFVAQDSDKMNKWGVLQLYEKIDDNVNAQQKVDALLNLYNAEEKKISVKNVFGDIRVRGGSLVAVQLAGIASWLLVEKVTHNFKDGEHFMNLTLQGGGYSV